MFNIKLQHHDHGCEYCSSEHDEHEEKHERIKKIIQLGIGAVVFLFAFLSEELGFLPNGEHFYSTFYFWLYIVAYIILGIEVVIEAFTNLFKGRVFDENFLMSIATITAFFVSEYHEAVMVMLLYQIGEFLQDIAVDNSHRSVKNLLDMKEVIVHRILENSIENVQITDIKIGDIILVKPGERVPLDGTIIEGKSNLNMSSLTGESLPVFKKEKDNCLSGSINVDSAIKIRIDKEYSESTVSKILECIENTTMSKAESERFVTKFAKIYTPIVVGLAALIVIIPALLKINNPSIDVTNWVHTACTFLVISCPCALVISIPLAYFIGIGASSKNGVLMKGSNYLEMLDKMDVLLFDKTGTLTKGSLNVTETSFNKEENYILEMVAALETYSTHPIAKAIVNYVENYYSSMEVKDFKENLGHGVQGFVNGTKVELTNKKPAKVKKIDKLGSIVYILIDDKFKGYIIVNDTLKDDAHMIMKTLKKEGIKTVMVSGDTKENAEAFGKDLGIDNVHSELLPTEKVDVLDKYLETKKEDSKVGFVGDGFNDAPVIAKSDIGISMGKIGSDAAVEVSDVVIMNDSLTSLLTAKEISKSTIKIVKENIIIIIAIKFIAMLFAFLDAINVVSSMPTWVAVLSDVGVCLLAILNSLRLFKYYK